MLNMNDLTHSLSRTWGTVNQGWNHLIRNASDALTHFTAHNDKSKTDNGDSASPHWGLISADLYDDADKVVVKLETPGLANDDFEINIIDNILTISGESDFNVKRLKANTVLWNAPMVGLFVLFH